MEDQVEDQVEEQAEEQAEDQKMILARSHEIEETTVPELPVVPRPTIGADMSEIIQSAKTSTLLLNSAFNSSNETLKAKVIKIERSGPLDADELRQITDIILKDDRLMDKLVTYPKMADLILGDDRLVSKLVERLFKAEIYDVLTDMQERLLIVERRLDAEHRDRT